MFDRRAGVNILSSNPLDNRMISGPPNSIAATKMDSP